MYICTFGFSHVPTPRQTQISPGRSQVPEKYRDPRIKTFPVIQGYLPGYGFSQNLFARHLPQKMWLPFPPLITIITIIIIIIIIISLFPFSLSLLTLFNSSQIQSIFSSGVIFIDKKKRKQKFLFSQNVQKRNSNMTFLKRYLISVNDFTYHTRRCLVYIASHISPMQQYQARGLMSRVRKVSLYQSILHLEQNKCLLTGTSISNQTHVGIE